MNNTNNMNKYKILHNELSEAVNELNITDVIGSTSNTDELLDKAIIYNRIGSGTTSVSRQLRVGANIRDIPCRLVGFDIEVPSNGLLITTHLKPSAYMSHAYEVTVIYESGVELDKPKTMPIFDLFSHDNIKIFELGDGSELVYDKSIYLQIKKFEEDGYSRHDIAEYFTIKDELRILAEQRVTKEFEDDKAKEEYWNRRSSRTSSKHHRSSSSSSSGGFDFDFDGDDD